MVRPLGAVVLGRYADRVGRKAALMLSIKLMMLGTLLIAVMPTYAAIGLTAPLGILLARLIQGFSAGGEFGSATAFLVEHAPRMRGFMSSWQFASQGISTLLAASFGTLLSSTLSTGQPESWGWRVPFFFGLLIGPVGYAIRRYVDESPAFAHDGDTATGHGPVAEVLRHHKGRVLLAVAALAVSTAITCLITYMPAVKDIDLPASTGFAATMVTGAVLTVVTPLVGHLSDKTGRIRVMAASAVLILLLIRPVFAFLVAHPGFGVMLTVMFLIGLLKAGYFGALPALLSDLFPRSSRATGMSISYNLGVMLFGGTTPVVIVWLVDVTGDKLAVTWYLTALAALSLAAVAIARRRFGIR
ncbi:MFS transporter [Streptomyces sp. RTd22]|uniref:MFS transporter n=1 Tax=Streptomyces sp. RTd22 TaxID=1841249 RepID=UPI001F1655F6|nr:MFS transporter [Streptomyces sp. RTd22]